MRFDRDVAVVTGAGAGIGLEAAKAFAVRGASVALVDANAEAVRAAATDIAGDARAGGHVRHFAVDVTDAEAVSRCIEEITAELGTPTILYANVGGTNPGDSRLPEVSDEVLGATLQRDLGGMWNACRAVLPVMERNGGGSVVLASSMTALIGRDGADAYTAAKGAVAALTRSLAVEYGRSNIRVNAVAPGATLTERVRARLADGKFPQELLDRHLLGLLEPEDVANVVVFLASGLAHGVTGVVVPVDSGVTAS